MKVFSIFITTGLALVCVAAFISPIVQAAIGVSCPQSVSLSSYTQEKVIYHQTMTPSWLEAHASYIDSSHSKNKEQLTFNAGPVVNFAALLKVPMIPAGVLHYSAPLTVKIVTAHDVNIGKTKDSDIAYGVSDGKSFIGFDTVDKGNYQDHAPCFGIEAISGTSLASHRAISYSSPRPSDSFYPGQYVFTLKLDERWGSCYTAHDGGFVKTAGYNKRLMFNKGLTLEVYKGHKDERVGIKFIEVTIIQDA
ncbi:hypothetical protein ACROYT_G031457 [Oculina patagonica]